MLLQNSLFDLPSLDSVVDRSPLTLPPHTSVTEAIALMSQSQENSCELLNTNLSSTSELLNRERNSCILVVDAEKLVGIFTERDAVKLAASQRDLNGIAIDRVMTRKLVTLKRSPNQTIFNALSLLYRHRIHHLPILDEREQLYGLVTPSYIRQILQPINLLKLKIIDEMMTKEIVYAPTTASLLNIAKLMEAHRISCVVIVEEEQRGVRVVPRAYPGAEAEINDAVLRPVGIITERDIVQFQVLGLNLSKIKVNKVMSTPLFTLNPEDSLWLAQREMQQRWIRRLVVTGAQGELQGLITQTDLLQAIDPVELLRVIEMLQQQVGEKTAALEQEISRRQQAEARAKQINDSLEMQVQERTAELASTNVRLQQEIEERRQAEIQLQAILDNTQAVIYLKDKQGRYLLINRRYEQLFNLDREWVKGKTDCDIFPKEIADAFQANDRQVFEAKKPLELEELAPQADGLHNYFSLKFPLFDLSGSLYGMCGISTDITERKQAEQEFRETLRSLEFQKYALDRAAIVAITDRQGTITYVNERFCQISKYKKEELIGQTHRVINSGYHPPELFQKLWRTIANGKVWQGEIKNKAKDSSFYWVETTIVPFMDEIGKPFQYLAIRFDITDRKQAEEDVRESKRRLSTLIDNLPGYVYSVANDPNYTPEFISEGVFEITGYRQEEYLIGRTISCGQDIHPEDRDNVWNIVQQAVALKQPYECEYRIITKAGNQKWVWERGQGIYDDKGEFLNLEGFVTDISDRKQAEENLQQSEQKFRAIFDGTFGFIGLLTTEGILIEANRTALDAIDAEPTDVMGQPFWQAPWWSHSPQLQKQLQQAIELAATGELVRFEAEHILANGTSIFVDFSLKPVFDATGKVVMLIPEGRDISDRKQAEQKVREQAALLDVTTDAILVRDLDSRIQYWNQGAEQIYGWQASEAIGQDVRSLLYAEVSTTTETAYATVTEKGEWQGELHKVTKIGKEVIVESRWTLMRDEADNPKFILSVDTDITDRKLLEAQFLRAQRLESLGTLASGIAHDMNNILTPILGASQLLPLKIKNPDLHTQRLLQISQESAKRGVDLVKQILSFARGAQGERTQMQISHILTEVVKVARQTFTKSIEINLNLANELWLISGDATQLHQVLMNLFINARDAMPEGGALAVTAENLRVDESYTKINRDAKVGSYVVITITDTGIGIPEETRERIFEPFFTTKEPGQGTGLGLSTVIGIIKSHQGFVNLYSEVGKGTSFKIFLPAEENIEKTPSVQDLELFKGNGELILVVDDETSIREITKATLENYNYRVLSANDGIQAIALYAKHQDEIAVVLLDLMMPSLDTSTIIRTLECINPQIKIIAMSGLSSNGEVVNTNYACVQAFLAKPFTSQKILQTLHDTVINN
jgi:PAS domain S-box-containing protein